MQNLRGVIKFFTIILVLTCIFQLSFTFLSNWVEGKADTYANEHVKIATPAGLNPAQLVMFEDSVSDIKKVFRHNYLDSVAGIPIVDVWGLRDIYTYKFCREHALSLGLDLKGGMSLIMEISEDDVLRKLSGNSKNPQFNQAIANAKKAQESKQGDFLSLFQAEFEKLNKDAKLAAIFATVESYQGKINLNSSNIEVANVLRKDFDAAIHETFQVLKTRIDQFGVASPNISLQENTGRIILELPGVDDPVRVRKLLQQTAQLEFWDTYETQEVINYLGDVNNILRESIAKDKRATDSDVVASNDNDTIASAGSSLFGDTTLQASSDTSALAKKDSADKNSNPLFEVLYPNIIQEGQSQQYGEGPMIGRSVGKDTARVNRLLARPEVRSALPRDLKLLWSAHPVSQQANIYGLYAIKQNPSSPEAPLSGSVINDAYQSYDQYGIPEVDISMNSMGAAKWEKMTEAAVNATVNGKATKKCIAIVLDNRVFSAPRVQQKISGGRSQITGIDQLEEAIDLANILKSGKLEARTQVIEEQVIGPSLGKESIKAGLVSLLLGVLLVFLFMVSYYSTSGIIANTAMFLNLFILIGALVSFGASFTLPAMAGIVLTLAMAVDANVIINERVREEVARGKGMRLAVEEGYSHSYNAIIDGNLTTMAIAIVLYVFGLGPIRGFGLVLIIGLITSMFTVVLVSRILFDWAFDRKFNIQFGNKFTQNLLKGTTFDFMGRRKVTYTISAVMLVVCISSFVFYGFDLGVDFKGGRSYVVQFDKDVKTEEVAKTLGQTLDGTPQVKTYGSNNQISITTAYMIDVAGPETDSIIEARIYEGVKPFFAEYPSLDNFRAKNVKSTIKIEASIADDIRQSSMFAVIFGFLLIFAYIFLRFKRWEYAAGAIIALVHDPIIVLGVFSLFRHLVPFSLEVDQTIVAAVLTLIGYSVNDTVVVFDRIRETVGLHPTRTLVQNVNDSINQTLSRTVMTVVTVFLVALILFLFGGTSIHGFAFALIIGLLVGTYSSIFVASPIVVDLMSRKNKTA
ncbi:MAG: protein translocase subunit SecDF [Bacteroidetes bacterium]|nr:protein translocase subunit SecDF [Bacteroidota bacterium]